MSVHNVIIALITCMICTKLTVSVVVNVFNKDFKNVNNKPLSVLYIILKRKHEDSRKFNVVKVWRPSLTKFEH